MIFPRGPVPPTAPFAVAAAAVMLLGLALDVVSLAGAVVFWVILLAYVVYSWRAGLWTPWK